MGIPVGHTHVNSDSVIDASGMRKLGMVSPEKASYLRRAICGWLGGTALAALIFDGISLSADFSPSSLVAAILCLAAAGAFATGGGLGLIASGCRVLAAWAARRQGLLFVISIVLTAIGLIGLGVLESRFGVHIPVQFQKTTQPQLAVFGTMRYLADAPVLDDQQRPMWLNGRRLHLDGDVLQQICRDKGMPDCSISGERILIKAEIHLEPCTITEGPRPMPDGTAYRPKRSCYAVVIDRLIDFAWQEGGRD